jgi:nitroreductase
MEFADLVRTRRMVRAFQDNRPVDPAVLDRVLETAGRAPSAGNTQGWSFVVLEGDDTAKFWDVTLPSERRESFRFRPLLDAPVIILPLASRDAYLTRYSEPDKEATGLADPSRWPVPYWQIDTAFATMLLLLAAQAEGLGALFFGVFRNAEKLLASLDVPGGYELIGAIALGHPAEDSPGRSVDRPRRPLAEVVHRGGWTVPEAEEGAPESVEAATPPLDDQAPEPQDDQPPPEDEGARAESEASPASVDAVEESG